MKFMQTDRHFLAFDTPHVGTDMAVRRDMPRALNLLCRRKRENSFTSDFVVDFFSLFYWLHSHL
jgi:hypothetical protein